MASFKKTEAHTITCMFICCRQMLDKAKHSVDTSY